MDKSRGPEVGREPSRWPPTLAKTAERMPNSSRKRFARTSNSTVCGRGFAFTVWVGKGCYGRQGQGKEGRQGGTDGGLDRLDEEAKGRAGVR